MKPRLMMIPGRIPAIRSADTEILVKLTLLAIVAKMTARFDGGISMSTPPMAMIGPVVIVG
jgi:hypothetical protein